MADSYTVLEADYLDQQEGLVPGTVVTAKPAESGGFLMVTHIGEMPMSEPVALLPEQLQPI